VLNWRYVDTNSVKISKNLPEGYYACTEVNGDIVIRNLKLESKEWGSNRDKFFNNPNKEDYPYCRHHNFQYIEMYHWGESPKYGTDYERDGCHIKPNDVVVDIGANIGMFTRLALEKGAKKVYAFEPSKDAFKCFLINIDSSEVSAYKACISDVSGFQDMNIAESTYPMAEIVRDGMKLETIEIVPSYTLDDLIDLEIIPTPIDFLKIDVEGSEIEVFRGLSDENLAKIDRIAMEAHYAPESGINRNDQVKGTIERLCQTFANSYQLSYNPNDDFERYWTTTSTFWR